MTINVTNIFRALLFLSPIVVAANINMDIFDLIFFRTGVMVLFMASLLDTQKRLMPQWVSKLVVALLSLCLFSLFNFKFPQVILMNTLNLFLGVLGFYIVYTYCDKDIDLKKPIAWAFIVNLILFAIQRAGFDPVYDTLSYGFIGNAARFGIYSALVTPFLPLGLILAGLSVVVFTKSYTMLIPIVLMGFLKANNVKKKILVGVVAFAIAFLLKDHIISQFTVRIKEVWMPILTIFFDQPLIGIGFGQNQVVGQNIGVYLNSYLQFVVGMGIFGLVWIIYALKLIRKNMAMGLGLISLLCLMFIEYPIEIPRFWFMIIAILLFALLNNKKEIAK